MKTVITGTVHFAVFPFKQSAKIYVTPPGSSEQDTGITVEAASGTSTGTFQYTAVALGVYTFRAEAVSGSQVVGGSGMSTFEVVAIVAPQPTDLFLTQGPVTSGSSVIRGTFDFAESVAPQWARVFYRLDGSVDWIDVGILVYPDTDDSGHFQIGGLPAGTWEVKVVPENADGPGTESDVETITTVTADPGSGVDPDGVSVSYSDFVINFYQGALGRDPTSLELDAEVDILVDAPDGLTWYLAARDIGDRLFTSAEYIARGRTDEEFIDDLYQAYLRRDGDAVGVANWLASLGGGMTRADVASAFGDSTEFRTAQCFRLYGWRPEETGGVTPTPRVFQFEFDGRGAEIDPLTQPEAVLPFSPFAGTIVEVYIKDLDDIAGSCEIDVRSASRGSAPPGSGQSLVGSGTAPATAAATESTLADLSDWDTDHIALNDEVRVVVLSNTDHEHLLAALTVMPD